MTDLDNVTAEIRNGIGDRTSVPFHEVTEPVAEWVTVYRSDSPTGTGVMTRGVLQPVGTDGRVFRLTLPEDFTDLPAGSRVLVGESSYGISGSHPEHPNVYRAER